MTGQRAGETFLSIVRVADFTMSSKRVLVIAVAATMLTGALAGCIGGDTTPEASGPTGSDDGGNSTAQNGSRFADPNATGAEPPPGEDYTGLQPIDLIFGGSLRHPLTRVALIPPTHGDLGNPTNTSRSALSYLEATLTGIFAWKVAMDRFADEYPEYSYLENVTIQVEAFEQEPPATAGYDIIMGYAETSGPAFRGVAFGGFYDTQQQIDEAGLGDQVHYGNRYILLSLFASAPRSGDQGQLEMDYPETHEMRGVTMHEFAHTWGLGHSTTWTEPYGPDLMNSPYPFVYGDGSAVGDDGERSPELCITTLDLYGLAHLYRWLPNGTANWQMSQGNVSLSEEIPYEPWCDVFDEASQRAEAWIADHRSELPYGR